MYFRHLLRGFERTNMALNAKRSEHDRPRKNVTMTNQASPISALIILVAGLCLPSLLAQTPYDLPNDNTNCPGQCRQIPWLAGSDQWNGGSLPLYTQDSACSGLHGDGVTDDGPAINSCISTAASGHAVYVPAGVYYINTPVTMKSNVALRGAKPTGPPFLPNADGTATTFKLGSGSNGSNGTINFGTGSSGARGSQIPITSGYTKGSTQLVLASISGISVGTWIILSENADTSIPVSSNGEDGACTWCGQDDGTHLMNQFVQVTAINANGCGSTCVTISRPMYYTYQSSLNPVARSLAFEVSKAGIENIRIDSSGDDHGANSIIFTGNALFCWVSGVETYMGGSSSGSAHIHVGWSHGMEIRDSYLHYGFGFDSGQNYGIHIMWANSDHKIENNIVRVVRHGIVHEGGGAGDAILYNYMDDIHESDMTYLGASLINHGAHPYMNLFEGNIFSHLIADYYWGTSSHNILFRNWLWGDESTPSASEWLYPAGALSKPNWGFQPIEIWTNQHYYSLVGNVLGVTGEWENPTWSSYLLLNNATDPSNAIYNYGYLFNSSGGADTAAYSTSINHGNYDFKTGGVAYWDGGSNHTLKPSMYYSSKPSFFGSCVWPAFGFDLNPITNTLPAKARYESNSACTVGVVAPPTGLTATVN